ncbi:Protein FAR1-RELATED SEQUENCE 3 [Linum grandiflorum]
MLQCCAFITNRFHVYVAGLFVGFNHHRKLIILGAALLYEETTESFEWLFGAFLECMRGKHPKSIFSDQCPAIGAGVRSIFPETFHGLCSFHLRENASKNLGIELAARVFRNGLSDAMYSVHTVDQFSMAWNRMIATTFPGETNGGHAWLDRLYKLRHQWSSAWVDNNRTCGMRSSQLSESCNASLRGFLDTKTNLPCFFREFARMLSGKRTEESQLDFKATVMFPLNYHPRSKIVNQAAKVSQFRLHFNNCTILFTMTHWSFIVHIYLCPNRFIHPLYLKSFKTSTPIKTIYNQLGQCHMG